MQGCINKIYVGVIMKHFFKKLFLLTLLSSLGIGASFGAIQAPQEHVSATCTASSASTHESVVTLSFIEQAASNVPVYHPEHERPNKKQFFNKYASGLFGKKENVFKKHLAPLYADFLHTAQAFCEQQEQFFGDQDAWQYKIKPKSFEKDFIAQRMFLPEEARVMHLTDIHGNFHSLVKIMRYWKNDLHIINDDFVFTDPQTYLVCLGDMGDRGAYSLEVMYVFMRLALANPGHVVLLRGNHECIEMNEQASFDEHQFSVLDELSFKIENNKEVIDNWYHDIEENVYWMLPLVCYLNIGGKIVQCCHAAPDIMYNPRGFLDNPDVAVHYEVITTNGMFVGMDDETKREFYKKILLCEQKTVEFSLINTLSSLKTIAPSCITLAEKIKEAIENDFKSFVLPSDQQYAEEDKLDLSLISDSVIDDWRAILQNKRSFDDLWYTYIELIESLQAVYMLFLNRCERYCDAEYDAAAIGKIRINIQNIYNQHIYPIFVRLDDLTHQRDVYISAIENDPVAFIESKPAALDGWQQRNNLNSWALVWSDIDVPGGPEHVMGRTSIQYSPAMIAYVCQKHGVFAVFRGHQHADKMAELLQQHSGVVRLWDIDEPHDKVPDDNLLDVVPVTQNSVITFSTANDGFDAFGIMSQNQGSLNIQKYVIPSMR
jgi:hypothetical protein